MLAKNLQGAALATQPAFIEDCFSSYLHTGTGSSQTITNGIDLSGKGGLVWMKARSLAYEGTLIDTARGANYVLYPNITNGEQTVTTLITGFSSSGFSVGTSSYASSSGNTYVSWTFREQAKFFDVVTYTGNGSNRTIAHNLGAVPGCIIIKRTDPTGGDWQVYHRSLANTEYIVLNSTAAKATGTTRWNSTTPTSTVFSLGTDSTVNANGGTYVAYLFAHDAGGFGASGSDNVISCGSFTIDGSGRASVTLGYEPQYVMIKGAVGVASGWLVSDTMREMALSNTNYLSADSASSEGYLGSSYINPTATGFTIDFSTTFGWTSSTFIYIAVRRGLMKTPTSGTSVFSPNLTSSQPVTITTPSAPDSVMSFIRGSSNANWNSAIASRLVGSSKNLVTSSTNSEASSTGAHKFNDNQGVVVSVSASPMSWYVFKRAPGFFDVVCYTGTGANRTVSHNLSVVPELMIVKSRLDANSWRVYSAPTGNQNLLELNTTGAAVASSTAWNNTSPTASVFTVGTNSAVNQSGRTFVAYLFATVPNVSKVGSYTGTGTTQQVNCGFTGGARFVLIKRTDSTGDWYVWDSARGIVAGNDSYLVLNSTAAEVTTTDWVDTYSAGFELSNAAGNNVNINGASYIFLSVA